MNLIEAITSGKPYRQKGDRGYYHPPGDCTRYTFTVEQILAQDWEVEETEVTVTYSKFWSTYRDIRHDPRVSQYDVIEELANRLGLKP